MKKEQIGNILQMQRGYDLPVSQMKDGDIPVVGSNGIVGYHNMAKCIQPTITIGRSGSAGKVHYYEGPTWVHNTAMFLTDFKGNNPRYLYYLLQLLHLEDLCGSSVIPSLNRNIVYPMMVSYHENKSEQDCIANVLTLIDKKIALNRAINRNLEAMAKQLYDYWFVQFDFPDENGKPYKSSGGNMVWNEKLKREIPESWCCGSLLDIAIYTNGIACQKFRPTNSNMLPVIKIREMHDGINNDTEYVKSDIPESVRVYDGDVLFSWSASLEVMLWAYGNGGLNQHIFKVTSKNGYPRSFYYYQLIDYIDNFKRMADARKTTMGHITQDHLQQSTIALPQNLQIVNALEKKLKPIFEEIILNYQLINKLQKQRDELLPLLMNGQVTVTPPAVNCDL
jgi:type I restriction enzyme S subunit